MTAIEMALACVAVAVGACAQGTIGFGLGMVAAPLLAIIDDDLVPVPLLMVALLLTLLVARRERGSLDWSGLRWAIIGRIPGTALGAVAVATLPQRGLIVVFAVLVLAGVLLSVVGWTIDPTSPTLFSAGAMSGFMGSITSIGGPPMALVYQRRSGSELRSTLSLFFVFGTALSIVLLAAAGQVGTADIERAAVLAPAMLVGFGLSRPLAGILERGHLRPVLLAVSACSATMLLVLELT